MTAAAKPDPVGLVEYIVKNIASHPEDVHVIPVKGPSSLVLELRVNKDDLGAVIGKNGRIARTIRNLLYGISVKKITLENGEIERYSRIVLEIIDE